MGMDTTPRPLAVGQKAIIQIQIPGGIDTEAFDTALKALLDRPEFSGHGGKARRLVTFVTEAPPEPQA